MGNQYEKKITWTIKNFSSLQSEKIYSDQFVVGGSKWRLLAYPKGTNVDNYLSLFLDVVDSESLPFGWKRHTKFRLTVLNQLSEELSQLNEAQKWFDKKTYALGYVEMLSLTKLLDKDGGFLVNGEVKIVAEVDVLEVICKSDVLEETSSVVKTMDVNGFQVFPSQVESVNSLFEKHPNIASKFRIKNQHMKTAYMNVLLSLTETLRQLPSKISKDDLADAYAALESMSSAGFKLDWLEKKLDEVKKKKQKVETSEIRMQEIKNELKHLKHKCSDLEAELEKEKAEVLAAFSLSDDDVV